MVFIFFTRGVQKHTMRVTPFGTFLVIAPPVKPLESPPLPENVNIDGFISAYGQRPRGRSFELMVLCFKVVFNFDDASPSERRILSAPLMDLYQFRKRRRLNLDRTLQTSHRHCNRNLNGKSFLLLKYLYETRATMLENSTMWRGVGGGECLIQFAY